MPRDLELANRLRAQGLKVIEVEGWRTRGSESFYPAGSVNHHTAGAATGNAPSLKICIYGRSDLPGPLCQALQARDNTIYVIAAGRANHAGTGGWNGLSGNSKVYGLEVENVGTTAEPWRKDQITTMLKVHRAFGVPAKNVCQHKEWTTRKPDAHSINGAEFRNLLTATPSPEVHMAKVPNPRGFCYLPNGDLVIQSVDGGLYFFDADGQADEYDWMDAYNTHPDWWGGSTPTTNRSAIGVVVDPIHTGHLIQVFDDGGQYRVRFVR